MPRDVDVVLTTDDTVRAFINDNRHGAARVDGAGDGCLIVATLRMPTPQHVPCAVSALMACLAELFSVGDDGWGTTIQRG